MSETNGLKKSKPTRIYPILIIMSAVILSIAVVKSLITFLENPYKFKTQFIYSLIIIATPIWFFVGRLLDRFVTAKIDKVSFNEISNKEARLFFRAFFVCVLIYALVGFFTWSEGPADGLPIWVAISLAVIVSLIFFSIYYYYKRDKSLYKKLIFVPHQQWAQENGFLSLTPYGLEKIWNNQKFYLSFDALKTSNNNSFEERSLLIKTNNFFKKPFALSGHEFYLWSEIGPEHLDLIENHDIILFATKDWFIARIKFSELIKFHIESLFKAMSDILKEMNYRKEAGFKYGEY